MLDHDTDSYYKISRTFLGGPPSGNLTRDHVLDNVTLYWLTGTGVSAARSYWGRCTRPSRRGRPGPSARHPPGRLQRFPWRDLPGPGAAGSRTATRPSCTTTSPPGAATSPPGRSPSCSRARFARRSGHSARACVLDQASPTWPHPPQGSSPLASTLGDDLHRGELNKRQPVRPLLVTNPLTSIRWRAPKAGIAVDPARVVNPVQARALLEAVASLPRGGRLVAFFACIYYAATRQRGPRPQQERSATPGEEHQVGLAPGRLE